MKGNRATDYLYGYILVQLQSVDVEDVMNRCIRAGIRFHEMQRISFTTVEFRMSGKQYKNLKNTIRGMGTRARIIKKHGFSFTIGKIGLRKPFLAGMMLFVAIVLLLSGFVWKVEVVGTKRLSQEELLQQLASVGLRTGAPKYLLDFRSMEEAMLRKNNNISVIKLNIEGTTVVADIVERTMPSEIVNKNKQVDIVAKKEGIITKVLVYQGIEMVSEGQRVKRGQLLISGAPQDGVQGELHAMGKVHASIWYEFRSEVHMSYQMEVRTGRFRSFRYYSISDNRIGLKNNNMNFKKYDKIKETETLSLFQHKLPLSRITETYFEKMVVTKKLTAAAAEQIAIRLAEKQAKAEIAAGSSVVSRKVTRLIGKDMISIKILYTVEEEIGSESIPKRPQ